jgi:hypothetical protein
MRRIVGALLWVAAGTTLLSSCGGGGGGGSRPRILVLAAADPVYVDDVRTKLEAFGVFAEVDEFDATAGTPSLLLLRNYDAVLVMPDMDTDDPAALGDVLADFVDSGGGVVLSQFVMDHVAFQDWGRFEDEDYFVISPGGAASGGGPFGMTVLDGSHPILDGVSTFSGGTSSYRTVGATVPVEYDLLAIWDDGASTPLVAVGTIGGTRRADLDFYPPTSDTGRSDFVDPSTDAMRIVANALRWVARDL